MRIGLLMCGHVHDSVRPRFGDYPELFASLFGPLGVEFVRFYADIGQLPQSVSECDGWITSPARASVTDDVAWITDTADFLREAVAREVPFAGVCFGHQLMAQALGGTVERWASGWCVGVHAYDVVEPQPWMTPPAAQFHLVASHEDQVTRLPEGAHLIATSADCRHAAFAVGRRAIGLQPHPDFTVELSAALLDLRAELIGASTVAAARATLRTPPDRELWARWLVNFFGGRSD